MSAGGSVAICQLIAYGSTSVPDGSEGERNVNAASPTMTSAYDASGVGVAASIATPASNDASFTAESSPASASAAALYDVLHAFTATPHMQATPTPPRSAQCVHSARMEHSSQNAALIHSHIFDDFGASPSVPCGAAAARSSVFFVATLSLVIDCAGGLAVRERSFEELTHAVLHETNAGRISRSVNRLRDTADARRHSHAHRHSQNFFRELRHAFEQNCAAGENCAGGELLEKPAVFDSLTNRAKNFFDARLDDVRQNTAWRASRLMSADARHFDFFVVANHSRERATGESLQAIGFRHRRAKARGDVARDVVAADGNHARVRDAAVDVENEIRSCRRRCRSRRSRF